MARIDAIIRAIPLPIFVLVYVLACVWAIVYAAGVADAQDGGGGAAPETGIAPRTTVLQSADAASEHVHEGHETAGMPDFGDPLQDIVVDF
ncbi:MAG: hypothetical protein OXQ29_06140, partial [Rhodospirillaceae bacterium]|nr:hypothetical protein [Rhodospirillaceae bacterium]